MSRRICISAIISEQSLSCIQPHSSPLRPASSGAPAANHVCAEPQCVDFAVGTETIAKKRQMMCRMYACVRALIFGEDFTSDPVSRALDLALRYFSGGTITLNVPLLSQVGV